MNILSTESRYDMKIKAMIIEGLDSGLECLHDDLNYWSDRVIEVGNHEVEIAKTDIALVERLKAQFLETLNVSQLDAGFNVTESRIIFHKMFKAIDDYIADLND